MRSARLAIAPKHTIVGWVLLFYSFLSTVSGVACNLDSIADPFRIATALVMFLHCLQLQYFMIALPNYICHA